MILNVIFLLTCYPILFVMYFLLRNAHNKNGYCFGATLKREFREDEAIQKIITEYQTALKKMTILLAIVILPVLCVPWMSISMTVWMFWLFIVCFYPSYFLAKGNKQVRELKQARGWAQVSEIAYTDLKLVDVPRKIRLKTFLPVLMVSTIPVCVAFALFYGTGLEAYTWMVAIFAFCTYLFYGCAIWTDKQKITIICEDSDTNLNFARAKKQVWKQMWMLCAWLNTAFTWLTLLFVWRRDWGLIGLIWSSIVYSFVLIAVMVWMLRKLHNINELYDAKRTVIDAADDDRHWIYGMLYYNKNDKHLMVENRMGTGTALNMATKVGMGTYIFSAIAMLSVPIICGWLILVEFTPIQTLVMDETIVCKHLSVKYEIPLADIEEYTMITDLPKMTKVNGTGMDNICSGTFDIYREGKIKVFFNPQNTIFIKVITEDETYYISGVDDAATQMILDVLEN